MLSIFTQILTFCQGQFTKGDNSCLVQALFTTGAFTTYLQTGSGKYASRDKPVFGWAGVSRPLLRADGGHFLAWQ